MGVLKTQQERSVVLGNTVKEHKELFHLSLSALSGMDALHTLVDIPLMCAY